MDQALLSAVVQVPNHPPALFVRRTAGAVKLNAVDDQLAFNTDNATANAGKVTMDFTNNSALDHDVVLVDSQNKKIGQTPVFQGGTKSFTAELSPVPTRTTAPWWAIARPGCRER